MTPAIISRTPRLAIEGDVVMPIHHAFELTITATAIRP
jgi:hypothetical protein